MFACALFAAGLPIFTLARRQHAPDVELRALFSVKERALFAVIVVGGVCGLLYTLHVGLFTGA